MYLCRVRVRHYSQHGAPYVAEHVVTVKSTLQAAVIQSGATPPRHTTASLCVSKGKLPEIVYDSDELPTSIDPPCIVLSLKRLKGGLFVHIPYKCSFQQLVSDLIPQKLQAIGVSKYDLYGSLEDAAGQAVGAKQLWCGNPLPQQLRWTKLRVCISHSWPLYVEQGVRKLQSCVRNKLEWVKL